MAKIEKVTILDVYLNTEVVGKLTKRSTGALEFIYNHTWLEKENPYPISQSLQLIETPYKGDDVYSFFENLLPDNPEIRKKMAEKLRASSSQTFDLLYSAGQDCVGAFQFTNHGTEAPKLKEVEGEKVDDKEIENILKNLKFNPLGNNPENEFRISIAGAQEKTALLRYKNEWIRPKGSTPTSHILKPPLGIFPNGIDMITSVENEWLCAEIARMLGLEVTSTEIMKFGEQKCLIVERFDRLWSKDGKILHRIPQEDLCQALGYNSAKKYESFGGPGIKTIMELLSASDNAQEDRRNFLKTQVLFLLLAAVDGHAKNFSIFQTESGFRLTPLYDILSAYPAISLHQIQKEKTKLAMCVGKSRHYKISRLFKRHWLETAKICSFSEKEMENIIEELKTSVSELIKKGITLPDNFQSEIYEQIMSGLKRSLSHLN